MNQIHEYLDAAVSKQKEHQRSLNQTMREHLARPRDEHLKTGLDCRKGGVVISRDVAYDHIDETTYYHKCFEKAPTKINVIGDLCMQDILKIEDKKHTEWVQLALKLKLTDISKSESAVRIDNKNNKPLPVHFTLKEGGQGNPKYTRAVFTVKDYKNIKIKQGARFYTLLHGRDEDNNALFFRWTTNPIGGEGGSSIKLAVKECVVIFNQSHQLKITHISSPLFNNEKEINWKILRYWEEKISKQKSMRKISVKGMFMTQKSTTQPFFSCAKSFLLGILLIQTAVIPESSTRGTF